MSNETGYRTRSRVVRGAARDHIRQLRAQRRAQRADSAAATGAAGAGHADPRAAGDPPPLAPPVMAVSRAAAAAMLTDAVGPAGRRQDGDAAGAGTPPNAPSDAPGPVLPAPAAQAEDASTAGDAGALHSNRGEAAGCDRGFDPGLDAGPDRPALPLEPPRADGCLGKDPEEADPPGQAVVAPAPDDGPADKGVPPGAPMSSALSGTQDAAEPEHAAAGQGTLSAGPSPDEDAAPDPALAGGQRSDLVRLPGAGVGLVWMLQECGVASLADLAASDAERLRARMGLVGQILDIEDWIAIARAETSSAAEGAVGDRAG